MSAVVGAVMRRIPLILALAAPAALAADAPALANAALRSAGGGLPDGWSLYGTGYDVRTECRATCAVHLQSSADPAQIGVVYQMLPAAGAAGRRLVLSGRIRTEDAADGSAFLYIAVRDKASPFREHGNGPPTHAGTTDWQRFEVAVAVPADAVELAVGAGMRGKGGAWIEDLELRVDDAVNDSAPPRPVPSQQLLDDAALAIPQADIPQVAPAWRADVLARRHPVRSLFSDDFSDLQFLKPLLQGKRIVLLGEMAHGVAESNWAKVRLIRFLHRELGFDVVAFEGGFDECLEAGADLGTAAPRDVMNRCLFPAWRTTEVEGLFDDMARSRKTAHPLALAGFDIQSSSGAGSKWLRDMLPIADAALAARLDEHERAFRTGKWLTTERSAAARDFYGEAAGRLDAARAALLAAGWRPEAIDVAVQTARSRIWRARQFEERANVPDNLPGSAIRDEGMAEQLDFVLDVLYPKRKVVVWSHNLHVTYAQASGGFPAMGEVLARQRRKEMYTVGFYAGRGMVDNGFGNPWRVAPPPGSTVEGVLANGGLKYAFVDFSQAAPGPGTAWFTDKNTVREFGTVYKAIVPARSFDGIFYIDTVTPPIRY